MNDWPPSNIDEVRFIYVGTSEDCRMKGRKRSLRIPTQSVMGWLPTDAVQLLPTPVPARHRLVALVPELLPDWTRTHRLCWCIDRRGAREVIEARNDLDRMWKRARIAGDEGAPEIEWYAMEI